MKEKRIEQLSAELRNTVERANRIIAILEKNEVKVRVWNKTNSEINCLEVVDIIQKVKY